MKYVAFFCSLFAVIAACQKQDKQIDESRCFRMGFANSAPRPDFNAFVRSLQTWSQRADAAIVSTEVPWDSLLSGETISNYIIHNYASVVQFYRHKNYKVWVYVDPENGLDRRMDADVLVKRGKSIADADMQNLYVQFVCEMDSLLQPDHLGLALETNLIRGSAGPSIYQGIINATHAAATAVRRFDRTVLLSVSVQADYAWGKNTGGPYLGIDQDLTDFAFLQELGISSYPYLNFKSPDDIPLNYYSRLTEGKNIPVMVTESGWTSADLSDFNGTAIKGSASLQKAYIEKQELLLKNVKGIAWFQLTFTDIALGSLPSNTPDNLKYFAFIGLADTGFQSKPALSAWDIIFKKSLR